MKECAGLKAYLTDVMDVSEKERFEAHLADCPNCRTAVEEDRAISAALSGIPKVNAPAGFATAIMREVLARRRSRLAWSAYGVAVVLVAALVGMILRGNVGAVAGDVAILLHSLSDFGASLYTAVHNISAVLFGALPLGPGTPVAAGVVFLILCFVFYKTAFEVSAGRR